MERKSRESEEERTRLHEKIAADLGAKHHPNQDFSEIGSQASAVTGMSQSTDGRNTYRTYDTGEVKGEYFSKSDELLRLTIKLREMDPDENDSKTEEAEARKSGELAATKATMISKFLVENPTNQDVDMEDGPAEIRGGGEDDEESGEKKIITCHC